MNLENLVLIIGGTLTALLAGLFFDYQVAVVPALRNLGAKQHLLAMQSINVTIVNPVFLLAFLGPGILLPLAAYLHRDGAPFSVLVAAAILHLVGVNGVTIAGNVPLNEALEKVTVTQLTDEQAEQVRRDFQGPGARWMRLHLVRTVAATLATALVFVACLSV